MLSKYVHKGADREVGTCIDSNSPYGTNTLLSKDASFLTMLLTL